MATATKKTATKKALPKKKAAKKIGKGGARDGAGAHQLVPNKVRKTIDIPEDVATKITKTGSDISSYMRKATYNQMVADSILTRKRADELINWKKKVA